MRVFEVTGAQVKVGFQLSPANLDVSGSSDSSLDQALSSLFYVNFFHTGIAIESYLPRQFGSPHKGKVKY